MKRFVEASAPGGRDAATAQLQSELMATKDAIRKERRHALSTDDADRAPRIMAQDPVTICWEGDEQSEYMVSYWEKGQENNPLLGVDYDPPGAGGLLLKGKGPHTCRLTAWGKSGTIPPGTKLAIYVKRRELGFQESWWNRGWEAGAPLESVTKAEDDDVMSPPEKVVPTWVTQLAANAGDAYASKALQDAHASMRTRLDQVAQNTQSTVESAASVGQGAASSIKTAANGASVLLDREDGARLAQEATRSYVRGAVVNATSAAPRVARMGGSLAAGVATIPTAVDIMVKDTLLGGVRGGVAGAETGASMGGTAVGTIGGVVGGGVGAIGGGVVGGGVGAVAGAACGAGVGGAAGVVMGAVGGGVVAGGLGAVAGGVVVGTQGAAVGAGLGAVAGGVGGVVVGGKSGLVKGAKAGRDAGEEIGARGGLVVGGAVGAVDGAYTGAKQGVRSGYDEIAGGAEEGGRAAQEVVQTRVDHGADVAADYVGALSYSAVDSTGTLAAATTELGGVTASSASEAVARLSTYAAAQEQNIRETASAMSGNITQAHSGAAATVDTGFGALGQATCSTILGFERYLSRQ